MPEAGTFVLLLFTVVGSGVLCVQWYVEARHWEERDD